MGIEADSERVEALLKELEGKDITEVIASGVSKLASVPAGGGGVAAAGGMSQCHAIICFHACSCCSPCTWRLNWGWYIAEQWCCTDIYQNEINTYCSPL